ncbi:MAG: TMEM175 family protein [Candidatus Dormibacteria bacterium]
MKTARVEAFSDAVFAVAITLLVLGIRIPATNGSLIGALADQWPAFAAFAISFLVIGIVWVNHHTLFHLLLYTDRTLLFINLGLLMAIVLIPFVTALFAGYVATGGSEASVAAALYNASMLLMGAAFQASVVWVGRHHELLRERLEPLTRRQQLRYGVGPLAYLACIPLAFANPVAVLIIDALVAVYYIFDQAEVKHVDAPA